jgi:hypothetical protein
MKEIIISIENETYGDITGYSKSLGMTADELADNSIRHYLEQYKNVGVGTTGEEFHKALDESANYLRRLRKKVRANRQIENPNKKPTFKIVR